MLLSMLSCHFSVCYCAMVPYPVFGAPAGIVVVVLGVGVVVGLAVCANVTVAAAKNAIAANSAIIVFCVNVILSLTTFLVTIDKRK